MTFKNRLHAACLIGCLIASSFSAAARDDGSEKVSLPVIFEPGATANVSFSKKLWTNQSDIEEIVKGTATIEIMGMSQNKPLISWTLTSFEVERDSGQQDGPVIEKLLLGLSSQFVADDVASPIKIRNKNELIAEINRRLARPEFAHDDYKSFVTILNLWTSPNGKENAEFVNAMSDFSTPFFNGLFLEIPMLTSLCQGKNLAVGEWDAYQEDFESVGRNIKMNVKYQLGSVDKANQVAKIYFRTTSDKDSQKKILAERRKTLDLPQPSEKEINDALIWLEERAQCSINLQTGWVQSMKYGIETYTSPNHEKKGYEIHFDWE